jgi:capsule polysaccharide export protein KpsE/RkpR
VGGGAKLPLWPYATMTDIAAEQEEKVNDFSGASELGTAEDSEFHRKRRLDQLRLLWDHRQLLFRSTGAGLIVATLIAFLIPNHYTSMTQLMPPDTQSTSNAMMLAGLAAKAGGGMGAVAGDLLGLKSSGALFVGMLQSQTNQNRLVEQFNLKKIYGKKLQEDARRELNENTFIQEDRKSGIISVAVTDESPERAAELANAYVVELNTMVSQLSTSSAHRERVFLEGRLQSVKLELDDSEEQLAEFSSKNKTLDMQQQGKAMLEAAAALSGQFIAAQSELEGLRQIYTDSNGRVRELNARVGELRKELEKLGGNDGAKSIAGVKTADASGADSLSGLNVGDPSSVMPYPSIRELPLLGAKWADYYRRAKVEETVSELLTEQYELAKVEEAKETPSVKVLDPAEVPLKKSYPPRIMVVVIGTAIAFALTTVSIIGGTHWQEIDPRDERKMFMLEIFSVTKAGIFRIWQNGIRVSAKHEHNS